MYFSLLQISRNAQRTIDWSFVFFFIFNNFFFLCRLSETGLINIASLRARGKLLGNLRCDSRPCSRWSHPKISQSLAFCSRAQRLNLRLNLCLRQLVWLSKHVLNRFVVCILSNRTSSISIQQIDRIWVKWWFQFNTYNNCIKLMISITYL